jgi:hypothetical protein
MEQEQWGVATAIFFLLLEREGEEALRLCERGEPVAVEEEWPGSEYWRWIQEYFHRGPKKKRFFIKGVKYPLKFSQRVIVASLYISLIPMDISPAFAVVGSISVTNIRGTSNNYALKEFQPVICGPHIHQKTLFLPFSPNSPLFFTLFLPKFFFLSTNSKP